MICYKYVLKCPGDLRSNRYINDLAENDICLFMDDLFWDPQKSAGISLLRGRYSFSPVIISFFTKRLWMSVQMALARRHIHKKLEMQFQLIDIINITSLIIYMKRQSLWRVLFICGSERCSLTASEQKRTTEMPLSAIRRPKRSCMHFFKLTIDTGAEVWYSRIMEKSKKSVN